MATRKTNAGKSAGARKRKASKTASEKPAEADDARRKRLAALKAQYSGDNAAPTAAPEEAGADDRRQRLQSLKEQFAKDMPSGVGAEPGPGARGAARTQAAELNTFLQSMGGRKQTRQHQLQLIKEFFDNPLAFGAEANIIPTSSTAEEIERRKKEVGYRIDLIKSVLAVLEGEMEMLNRGRPAAGAGKNGAE